MPPKKATAVAAAATKTKQVNGVKATTKSKASATPAPKVAKTAAAKAGPAKAAPKTAPTKAAPKSSTTASKKRKAESSDNEEPEVNGTAVKRAKKESTPVSSKTTTKKTTTTSKRADSTPAEKKAAPVAKKTKTEAVSKGQKGKPVINERPTKILDLYLFGGGEAGELGFAGAKGTKEIKRPRLNQFLEADKAGVVQFSVGGMHTAALTHDNKILTWGVNDQGALGRDTTWEGGLTDMKEADEDSDSESDSDEGEINPFESKPGEVDFSGLDHVPEFTQVVASDSATFALTEEGLVYGWGTFRSNEGIFGFSKQTQIQDRPALVQNLTKITKLAAGTNHILALDKSGAVHAWGAGQQNQLGRRMLERYLTSGLLPAKVGLKGKYVDIGTGSFHSFAIKNTGEVFSWGLNSFGQTGCEVNSDEGGPDVHLPTKVESLSPDSDEGKVVHIVGGSHHSIAVTDTGAALTWGRLDGFQVGLAIDKLQDDDIIRDGNNRARILKQPTRLPDIDAVTAEAGSDHSIVVAKDGKAYSFGFNEYGQCGVGNTDDVKVAELIENTAVRGKKLVAVGCGGQFSCLGAVHEKAKVNGVNGA